ncbi:MAG: aminodeoxychorismate synthase component I [Chitinophagaceae bacterium]
MDFAVMNTYYQKKIPFFFIFNFDLSEGEVLPLQHTAEADILYSTKRRQNFEQVFSPKKIVWNKSPVLYEEYERQFNQAQRHICRGNSYLINLTFSTLVKTNCDLLSLFYAGKSPYKLFYKNRFIHFSPEPFVKITGDEIVSFPMKGTIDAGIPQAEENLLNSPKEINEQYIIVDLIRNDLSMIAREVRVESFRYMERIRTNEKELLTISSKIKGKLIKEFRERPGDIFKMILPAGSICGAPKRKTLEIIAETETHKRNFYTGVWGIFDGMEIDSCVIIRYLENENGNFFYKSGGGITAKSHAATEYQEMIDKVYVPVY